MGATGQTPNGIAIFPNRETGDRAHDSLLIGSAYKNMTLGQIIGKWAPNNENNPAEYYKTVKNKLNGIDMDKTYAELTPEEKSRFRSAQTDVEHGTNTMPAGGRATAEKPAARVMPNATAQAIEDQAQAIYNGDQPMPTGLGANNMRNQAVVNRVQEIASERGKPFDSTMYKQRQDTETKFNTGQQGNAVRSMNVAIDHMDTLRSKIQKLPTGQYPAVNEVITSFAKGIGDPRINSYDAAAGLIAAEVTKAIVANGGTGDERAEKEKLLAVKNNPEALRATLDSYTKLLGGQLRGLKEQYVAGHGKDFESKVNDRTRQAMAEGKIDRAWNPQDKAAVAWVKANPTDPRSEKIKQRLGLD
jgi:hypothetical protein